MRNDSSAEEDQHKKEIMVEDRGREEICTGTRRVDFLATNNRRGCNRGRRLVEEEHMRIPTLIGQGERRKLTKL